MNIRTFVAKLQFLSRNPQYDFPKMRGGGAGSKAVWNFSENSSVLVGPGFPKHHDENVDLNENTCNDFSDHVVVRGILISLAWSQIYV